MNALPLDIRQRIYKTAVGLQVIEARAHQKRYADVLNQLKWATLNIRLYPIEWMNWSDLCVRRLLDHCWCFWRSGSIGDRWPHGPFSLYWNDAERLYDDARRQRSLYFGAPGVKDDYEWLQEMGRNTFG
jgi:hypothetical protein